MVKRFYNVVTMLQFNASGQLLKNKVLLLR